MPENPTHRREILNDNELGAPFSSVPSRTVSIEDSTTESEPAGNSKWPQTARAYFCWIGCFFLMFNSWGLVNAYGTFSSYYVGHSLRDAGQLRLNAIGGTQSALILLLSLPVGRLLDAGYSRWLIGAGTFLVPFGQFMLAVAHPAGEIAMANYAAIEATQGVVTGLGMAGLFVTSSQVAATWFPNLKGLAVGVVACGASIGGVIYPVILRECLEKYDFRIACIVVGGFSLGTMIFALVFATPNPDHPKSKSSNWGSMSTWIDVEAFRNPAWVWFTLAVAFMFFGFYPVFFNIEEWAALHGYGTRDGTRALMVFVKPNNKPLETFWLLAIMNGASTIGRLAIAAFSDKTGQLNMHIGAEIVCAFLCWFFWPFVRSIAAAIVFCGLFGTFSGSVIGLPPASMANILRCTYNTKDDEHLAHAKLGHWTGMMYSFAALPAVFGPMIAGTLISKYNNYLTVQMWSGTCLFLSALCMIMSRWYLPCDDGETVPHKIQKWMANNRYTRKYSTTDTLMGRTFLSRATSRAPSEVSSTKEAAEKVEDPNTVTRTPGSNV